MAHQFCSAIKTTLRSVRLADSWDSSDLYGDRVAYGPIPR